MSDNEQKGAKYISTNLFLHRTELPDEETKEEKIIKLEAEKLH